MATHSSILAWEILWTEEPGELQSLGSQRVRHARATKAPPPPMETDTALNTAPSRPHIQNNQPTEFQVLHANLLFGSGRTRQQIV